MRFTERKILTVSELTAQIRELLENSFESVWVEGEISNFKEAASGHFYFVLKDEESQIKAIMFRLQTRYLKFRPEDGLTVICWGRLTVYEPRGEYQLVVDLMEPSGLGAFQLAFERLKRKLAEEGLFDPSRKKPLPVLPATVGVVTSSAGAAIKDILTILKKRFPNINVVIAPVQVQGDEAAGQIAQAIRDMNSLEDIDLIIAGRGGGSIEDLWPFNEEVVARAIADSRVPVISAVGHEVDFTIADFVADVRAPTPSAAAELAVPVKAELEERINRELAALFQLVYRKIRTAKDELARIRSGLADPRRKTQDWRIKLDDLVERIERAVHEVITRQTARHSSFALLLMARNPEAGLRGYEANLTDLTARLATLAEKAITQSKNRLQILRARLEELAPLGVLARGYSITRNRETRAIITDSSQVAPGQEIEIQLHKGGLDARVLKQLADN